MVAKSATGFAGHFLSVADQSQLITTQASQGFKVPIERTTGFQRVPRLRRQSTAALPNKACRCNCIERVGDFLNVMGDALFVTILRLAYAPGNRQNCRVFPGLPAVRSTEFCTATSVPVITHSALGLLAGNKQRASSRSAQSRYSAWTVSCVDGLQSLEAWQARSPPRALVLPLPLNSNGVQVASQEFQCTVSTRTKTTLADKSGNFQRSGGTPWLALAKLLLPLFHCGAAASASRSRKGSKCANTGCSCLA
jgi:hypothetical protein